MGSAVAISGLEVPCLGFSGAVPACVSPTLLSVALQALRLIKVSVGPVLGLSEPSSLSGERAFLQISPGKSGDRKHTLPTIRNEGNERDTCLGEHNGHHEEIQEETLRDVFVVEVEKDDGETQVGKLVNRVAEGRPQQLHACRGHQEDVPAVETSLCQ